MDKGANDSNVAISTPPTEAANTDYGIYGEYTAGGTVCAESAINNVVARVHLDPLNLFEYLGSRTREIQATDVKKGVKRKLQESLASDTSTAKTVRNKKGRGRPRKAPEGVTSVKIDTEDPKTDVAPIKKRGRPRKTIDKETESITPRETENASLKSDMKSNFKSLNIKKDLLKLHGNRYNGDRSAGVVTTSRVRKPNSKFQDFVVSPNIRNFMPSGSEASSKEKLLSIKAKIKPKPPKPVVSTSTPEDPLALSTNDEVVRSFLPFDEPPRFDKLTKNNKGGATAEPASKTRKFKEKENQVNNVQPKIKKNTPSEQLESDKVVYSPPKLRSRSDSKTSTPAIKSPKIKVVGNSYKDKQQREKTAINGDTTTPLSKPKLKNPESSLKKSIPAKVQQNDVLKGTSNVLKSKTKVNGSTDPIKQKKDVRYVLIDSDGLPHRTKVSKLGDVDFNKLVRSLKSVKLPAANWKIRIVVSRQQTITEVTFTNKEVNERCVKFSRIFTGYIITFGENVVKLIGAPSKISSFNDVTVLLDIIHHVSSNDPVLEYSADNNV